MKYSAFFYQKNPQNNDFFSQFQIVMNEPYLYALVSTYVPEHFSSLTQLACGLFIKEARNGRTYANGVFHSFNDQPAVIWEDGIQEWYRFGKAHRDSDQPAMIWPGERKEWWRNGQLHRGNDQPAVISCYGNQRWYQNGQLHRDNDQPAVIKPNGTRMWYRHGVYYGINKKQE